MLLIPELKNVDCIHWYNCQIRRNKTVRVATQRKMDLLMHGIVRSFIMHWKKCAIAEVRKSLLQNMRYPVMGYGKHFMWRVADVWQRQEKRECFMMTVK